MNISQHNARHFSQQGYIHVIDQVLLLHSYLIFCLSIDAPRILTTTKTYQLQPIWRINGEHTRHFISETCPTYLCFVHWSHPRIQIGTFLKYTRSLQAGWFGHLNRILLNWTSISVQINAINAAVDTKIRNYKFIFIFCINNSSVAHRAVITVPYCSCMLCLNDTTAPYDHGITIMTWESIAVWLGNCNCV